MGVKREGETAERDRPIRQAEVALHICARKCIECNGWGGGEGVRLNYLNILLAMPP
eukprot:SAG11_NODE_285_length_11230_cov_6.339412_14_plen_56_part_00